MHDSGCLAPPLIPGFDCATDNKRIIPRDSYVQDFRDFEKRNASVTRKITCQDLNLESLPYGRMRYEIILSVFFFVFFLLSCGTRLYKWAPNETRTNSCRFASLAC